MINKMKKIILILLAVVLVLGCFTGCQKLKPSEPTQEPLPTNGVVVTPEESLETSEAEEAIIEIVNK